MNVNDIIRCLKRRSRKPDFKKRVQTRVLGHLTYAFTPVEKSITRSSTTSGILGNPFCDVTLVRMTESPSDSNCSETSKLSLSLSCESSSFEEELETVLEKPAVTPYQFEPYLSDSDENDLESPTQHGQDDGNSADSRLNNTDWYCSFLFFSSLYAKGIRNHHEL